MSKHIGFSYKMLSIKESEYLANPSAYIRVLVATSTFAFYVDLSVSPCNGFKVQGVDNITELVKKCADEFFGVGQWFYFPALFCLRTNEFLILKQECPQMEDYELMLDWMQLTCERATRYAARMERLATEGYVVLNRRTAHMLPVCNICGHRCGSVVPCDNACDTGCSYSNVHCGAC